MTTANLCVAADPVRCNRDRFVPFHVSKKNPSPQCRPPTYQTATRTYARVFTLLPSLAIQLPGMMMLETAPIRDVHSVRALRRFARLGHR